MSEQARGQAASHVAREMGKGGFHCFFLVGSGLRILFWFGLFRLRPMPCVCCLGCFMEIAIPTTYPHLV